MSNTDKKLKRILKCNKFRIENEKKKQFIFSAIIFHELDRVKKSLTPSLLSSAGPYCFPPITPPKNLLEMCTTTEGWGGGVVKGVGGGV